MDEPAEELPLLAPALLSGDARAAIPQLQSELREKLAQPELLLGDDAFRRFHRITLAPSQPPPATGRLRRPLLQIELLTDGKRCWLRPVNGEAWPVDGVACQRVPAVPDANPSYTN